MLTQEYLKYMFEYDPETGLFTRLIALSKRSIVGQVFENLDAQGYVVIEIKGKKYKAHRLAFLYMLGHMPVEVDHKNNICHDNRWENLRETDRSHNKFNQAVSKNNKLGVKGVCLQDGYYKAKITINKEVTILGFFKTLEEAEKSYNDAAKLHHKEFLHKSIS